MTLTHDTLTKLSHVLTTTFYASIVVSCLLAIQNTSAQHTIPERLSTVEFKLDKQAETDSSLKSYLEKQDSRADKLEQRIAALEQERWQKEGSLRTYGTIGAILGALLLAVNLYKAFGLRRGNGNGTGKSNNGTTTT